MRLGDCIEVRKGVKPVEISAVSSEGFRQLLQIEDLRPGATPKFCLSARKEVLAEKTDVVIAWDGANAGISAWGLSGAVGSTLAILRPRGKKFHTPFLGHFVRSQERFLRSRTKGATVPHLDGQVLASLELPDIGLDEQRHIAAILDKADALRAKRREAIAKLDQLLQSVFLDMFGDPMGNPKGWPTFRLEEVIKFTGGAQPPKAVFSDAPKPGYIRLVQIRDFRTEKFATYIPEGLARRKVSKKDVMIGRYGPPVFQIFRGLEGSYNVALMKAEPKEKLQREYLFHLLKSDSVQSSVIANSERSAGQSGVNLDFLHGIEVGVPPICLQNRFASIAESLITQRTLSVRSQLQAEQLFNSLQHRAFQGSL